MIITVNGEWVSIKYEGDAEPIIVKADALIEVLAEKFPQKIKDMAKFLEKL